MIGGTDDFEGSTRRLRPPPESQAEKAQRKAAEAALVEAGATLYIGCAIAPTRCVILTLDDPESESGQILRKSRDLAVGWVPVFKTGEVAVEALGENITIIAVHIDDKAK